jgi:hypothetical protein
MQRLSGILGGLAPVVGFVALILIVQLLYLRWEAQRLSKEVPPEIAGNAAREEAYRIALEIERRRSLATMRRVAIIAVVLVTLLIFGLWLSARGR